MNCLPSLNIYESIPFASIHNMDFVFENGNFHHIDCSQNDYRFKQAPPDSVTSANQ